MKKRIIVYNLGNALMIGAVALALFIYFPIIQLYFFDKASTEVYAAEHSSSYYIKIPKINAAAPIIPDVNPWDANQYLPALQKGVAQAAGFSSPGEPGVVFLFAHSSEWPWQMTRTNTAFFKLGELTSGDKITIFKNGTQYVYTVKSLKEVWPSQVNVLKQLSGNWLVLQTCTPIGTSLKRLLVFASPTS